MKKLLLSLIVVTVLGVTPALAYDSTQMDCVEYHEVRDIIIETDLLSQEAKDQLLNNLESYLGLACLWPSFIP